MRSNMEAGGMQDIQQQVEAHFQGSWPAFLDAVKNPVEILLFVLSGSMEEDKHQFQEWASVQQIKEGMVIATLDQFDNPPEKDKPRGGIAGGGIEVEG